MTLNLRVALKRFSEIAGALAAVLLLGACAVSETTAPVAQSRNADFEDAWKQASETCGEGQVESVLAATKIESDGRKTVKESFACKD